MCGRYVLAPSALIDDAESPSYWEWLRALPPRYNIAPQQGEPTGYVPIVRHTRDNVPELAMMQWWLLPYWSKTPRIRYTTFNARAEELTAKPAFREPFRRRRCLVPATGWYEWQEMPRPPNLPWYIYPTKAKGVMLAGVWDRWKSEAEVIESCSIIVTKPNAMIASFHDRMPVVLEPRDYALWLDRGVTDPALLAPLLGPAADDALAMHRVSTRVNNARNEGPDLIAPLDVTA
jgi:putative SOS response-associated peptidase YedK